MFGRLCLYHYWRGGGSQQLTVHLSLIFFLICSMKGDRSAKVSYEIVITSHSPTKYVSGAISCLVLLWSRLKTPDPIRREGKKLVINLVRNQSSISWNSLPHDNWVVVLFSIDVIALFQIWPTFVMFYYIYTWIGLICFDYF